mmetsp:Transcript_42109/g.95162  ORF Transcript_42109/g.95162 Transcript_42109/m.95162 type:complete len:255 (+) Transcript_42109:396-1160(+)
MTPPLAAAAAAGSELAFKRASSRAWFSKSSGCSRANKLSSACCATTKAKAVARKVAAAHAMPTCPICSARVSSRLAKGVFSASSSPAASPQQAAMICPSCVASPTRKATHVHEPVCTTPPAKRKGSLVASFGTASLSPVRLDSSHSTREPRTKRQSHGTLSPVSRTRTSPTTTSERLTNCALPPPRITRTSTSFSCASRASNCFWAEKSLVAETTPTMSTAAKIAAPSTQPPDGSSASPTTRLTTAEPMRIQTV